MSKDSTPAAAANMAATRAGKSALSVARDGLAERGAGVVVALGGVVARAVLGRPVLLELGDAETAHRPPPVRAEEGVHLVDGEGTAREGGRSIPARRGLLEGHGPQHFCVFRGRSLDQPHQSAVVLSVAAGQDVGELGRAIDGAVRGHAGGGHGPHNLEPVRKVLCQGGVPPADGLCHCGQEGDVVRVMLCDLSCRGVHRLHDLARPREEEVCRPTDGDREAGAQRRGRVAG
eukprot:4578627-Prymnesium_polylepis.1